MEIEKRETKLKKTKEAEKEKKSEEKEEIWMVNLGDNSEPMELTKSKDLSKNPSKRPAKSNPNISDAF